MLVSIPRAVLLENSRTCKRSQSGDLNAIYDRFNVRYYRLNAQVREIYACFSHKL